MPNAAGLFIVPVVERLGSGGAAGLHFWKLRQTSWASAGILVHPTQSELEILQLLKD